jgi:hypothetical protein
MADLARRATLSSTSAFHARAPLMRTRLSRLDHIASPVRQFRTPLAIASAIIFDI